VIRYLPLKNPSVAEIATELQNVYSTDALKYSTVSKWRPRFQDGSDHLFDLARSGRPSRSHLVEILRGGSPQSSLRIPFLCIQLYKAFQSILFGASRKAKITQNII
jgi:hypothetical protein